MKKHYEVSKHVLIGQESLERLVGVLTRLGVLDKLRVKLMEIG